MTETQIAFHICCYWKLHGYILLLWLIYETLIDGFRWRCLLNKSIFVWNLISHGYMYSTHAHIHGRIWYIQAYIHAFSIEWRIKLILIMQCICKIMQNIQEVHHESINAYVYVCGSMLENTYIKDTRKYRCRYKYKNSPLMFLKIQLMSLRYILETYLFSIGK